MWVAIGLCGAGLALRMRIRPAPGSRLLLLIPALAVGYGYGCLRVQEALSKRVPQCADSAIRKLTKLWEC